MTTPIRPGPTGDFLKGKPMSPGDLGGVYAKFGVISKKPPLVGLDLGTVASWVAQTMEDALKQAHFMREIVLEAFGPLSYDASTLPLKITAIQEGKIVRTDFPQQLGVLAANPHVFLAWADKLEEAVAQLGGKA